jgi:Ca-activated chloride channel family protein
VQLAPDLNLEDGTAVGMGLASAANMLRTSTKPTRIIILLTDGANNAGSIDPRTAARSIAALGMRVYTIGMGKTGFVPIPIDDLGNTRIIESDLDEEVLSNIASLTGGVYFRAVDLTDLQRVYDQIDVLERSDVERQVFVRWQEQGLGWMAAGLVLLVVERLLRHSVFQTVP